MPTDLSTIESIEATSESHISEIVQAANQAGTAVYPIGGGVSLNYGLPAMAEGVTLSMTGMSEVIDYPARDMTITVGAGITLDNLHAVLARESQQLPIDTPCSAKATLGGVIATNHSGPRRYAHGTMRDSVIGIRAIDGRGGPFAAGGRVVKNVAGYDFCKLLTGSMGTLGVITEVTLKVRPLPVAGSFVVCCPDSLQHAERLLAGIVRSESSPNLVELLTGPDWAEVSGHTRASSDSAPSLTLVVGFEGTQTELDWMSQRIRSEWSEHGAAATIITDPEQADTLYHQLVDFSEDQDAAMVIKLTGVPSNVTTSIEKLLQADQSIKIQAHAGNGIIIAKFSEYPGSTSHWKAVAASGHGTATILSNPGGAEMTHHNVWGAADVPFDLMRRVKSAFDPNNVLNPGRFVY